MILSDAVSDSLCKSFSQFFIDKFSDLKQAVASSEILTLLVLPLYPELLHLGRKLENFTTVTPAEVLKVINTIPSKSSRLDYIPTSLTSCSSLLNFADLISGFVNLSLT